MGWSKTFEDNFEDSTERFESSDYYQDLMKQNIQVKAVLITGQSFRYGNTVDFVKGEY
ncbi:MAG: hypothetical protein IJG23_06635 [Clostridia bacterium]|nr:hypothetical protein [Clostridia bacterium]